MLFEFLGWITSFDKAVDFKGIGTVLGLEINLGEAHLGHVFLGNTDKRRRELEGAIGDVLNSGSFSSREGASLRGRLIFAENQIFGRGANSSLRCLSSHILSGSKVLQPKTIEALSLLKVRVIGGRCREVSIFLGDTFHMYVDASYEPGTDTFAGIGGVLVGITGEVIGHFSTQLSSEQILRINTTCSKHPIFELECLAIFLIVRVWGEVFRGRHLIIFTDNNGSLAAMISGDSANEAARGIITELDYVIDSCGLVTWFERVNTASNIADLPSRTSCPEALAHLSLRFHVDLDEILKSEAFARHGVKVV